jgi:dihydrofolate reductase
MRKLKLQIQMSLDGFVAGPNGEQDWIWIGNRDEKILHDIISLADTCDTILLGRKMTRMFVDYWEKAVDDTAGGVENPLARRIVGMRKIVFSKTESSIKGRNLEVENGDLATAVRALKNQPGKDLLVYGGANFVSSLISQNLVDEYYIIRRPVAIGEGMSVFNERKVLQLQSSVVYNNGTIRHTYVPVSER